MSENTGTSIEAPSVEPITKSGSSADLTSFDELEAVMEAPKASKSQRKDIDNSESKSKAKAEPKESKAKPAKKEASDKDSEGSEDDEESSDESDDESTQKDDKGKEKPSEKSEKDSKSQVKAKSFKIKNGDQEIDLRSDSTFEVTVNGQKQTVTAQELVNEFSGKTNWGKKYQELDVERKTFDTRIKEFETSKQEYETGIQNWAKLANENPVAAIERACEASGADPRKVIQDLRSQFETLFEEWSQLSPEERQQRQAQEETEYYKTKAQKLEADRAEQTLRVQLDNRVKATISKHKLDKASYISRYDELKQLQKQGVFKGELTPELVGDYHEAMERVTTVDNLIKEVVPELELQTKETAFKELKAIWDNDPSLTVDNLKEIARQVYGSQAAQKLARKVKKSSPATPTYKPKTSQKQEPLFFDELE